MTDARTVFEMGVREYGRTPILLALLGFLPAYFILVFTWVMPDHPLTITLPNTPPMELGMADVVTVVMAPLATALVGGVAGLFLMQSARDVDTRLAIVGVDVPSIILGRGTVVALAAATATVVSTTVLALVYVPNQLTWFLTATLVVGLTYAAIGAVVGLVLNRLAGIYILLFGPLLDIFLAQSPLSTETPVLATILPSHYPMQLAISAAFTTSVDPTNLGLGLTYLLGIGVVTVAAFTRTLRRD